MARNGRNGRGPVAQADIDAVHSAYLKTGDLHGACAEVGVNFGAVEVAYVNGGWSEEYTRLREQRLLDRVADDREEAKLKRRANALHCELAEDALIAARRQWRDRWQAEVASMTAMDGARVFKTLGEALKSLQFVHRIALGMDTEKIGSEATEALLTRIREAKDNATKIAAERCPDSGGPDGAPPAPPAS